MKTAITYPLIVKPEVGNDTRMTASEADRIRDRLAAAIREATVKDNAYAPLRNERQRKRGAWKKPDIHRWLPPISPLSLMAYEAHLSREGPVGRIVCISVRCSYGGHVL